VSEFITQILQTHKLIHLSSTLHNILKLKRRALNTTERK